MASTSVPSAVVRFGTFEADLQAGELRRNGVKVRLQDLPFRAMTHLVTHPGVVISRDEFRQVLWPSDVFVDFEQGISSAIMRLRDALGDSADNPIFIQTVERRGYRWIAPIHPPEPSPEDSIQEVSPTPESTPAPSRFSAHVLLYVLPVALLLFLAIWSWRPQNSTAHAGTSSKILAPRHVAKAEAEDLYLKGRYYWNKRTPESLNLAVDSFTQAIVHDPDYSDAYVGLADCYNLMREFAAMPPNEAYLKSFAAAKKAVELDPQSSAAHTSLAFVTYWGMWNAPGAETEFRRALELNPNNAQAHHWYATFLHALARHQEALSEIEIARKLDPNSSAILADTGEILIRAGQTQKGIELLHQLEAADPNFLSPHRYLRSAYSVAGDYPRYIEEWRKEANLTKSPSTLAVAEAAAKGFARDGEHGLFESQLLEQKKQYERGKLSPYVLAESEARLGNSSEMQRYLNLCLLSHDENLLTLAIAPAFTKYRDDPQFRQFTAQIKPAPEP